jgi:hypothetical protein
MDTYTLQRLILSLDLLPAEKLVGMALALHLDRATSSIRIKQEKIATESGFSVRSVKRATKGLIDAGVFTSKKTRGASVLIPTEPQAHGKNSGMDVPRVAPQRGHRRHHKTPEQMPWDYDTASSSRCEEELKRPLYQGVSRNW